jgi:retinol dehydrogenase 12
MAKLSIGQFVRSQRKRAPVIQGDLAGQTIIVIDANIGLGLEASKQFAMMNPTRLIIACRNRDKGEAAVAGGSTREKIMLSFTAYLLISRNKT